MNDNVLNEYFKWLYDQVKKKGKRYKKLIMALHNIKFRYSVDYDENRALDGTNLRWYFVDDGGDDDILQWDEPCTVLEMIVALSLQIVSIMDVENVKHWFWVMLDNLNIAWMTDDEYDKTYLYGRIAMFMDREYGPDGDGNIFYIPECSDDLRDVEIWCQMCWYLDSL